MAWPRTLGTTSTIILFALRAFQQGRVSMTHHQERPHLARLFCEHILGYVIGLDQLPQGEAELLECARRTAALVERLESPFRLSLAGSTASKPIDKSTDTRIN